MNFLASASVLVWGPLLAVATWHDLRRMRIPNSITYSSLLAALLLASAAWLASRLNAGFNPRWLSAIGIGEAVAGAAVGFVLMGAIYSITNRGAGDVKLATALGALFGPLAIVNILLWTCLAAGVFAILFVIVAYGRQYVPAAATWFIEVARRAPHVPSRVSRPAHILRRPVPLAGFFVAGVALTLGGF